MLFNMSKVIIGVMILQKYEEMRINSLQISMELMKER